MWYAPPILQGARLLEVELGRARWRSVIGHSQAGVIRDTGSASANSLGVPSISSLPEMRGMYAR